jgi:hypothetical protein
MPSRYDLQKVKLGKVLRDPEAKAIIDRYAPDLSKHPMFAVAKTLSVAAVLQVAVKELGPEAAESLRTQLGALEE